MPVSARTLTALAFLLGSLPLSAQVVPNSWSDPAGPSHGSAAGGGLVASGTDTLYFLAGGGSVKFSKFTISTQTWAKASDIPVGPSSDGCIAKLPGTNYLFATVGGYKAGFYRYDTVADSWSSMSDLPAATTGTGGAIVGAKGKVYALLGSQNTYPVPPGKFHVYTPDAGLGSWSSTPLTAPGPVSAGCTLATLDPNGDLIHATLGTTSFMEYSIAGNAWTSRPALPTSGGTGTVLVAKSATTLLCSTPNATGNRLFEFTTGATSWSVLADASSHPAPIGAGGGIAQANGLLYMARGNGLNHIHRYSLATNKFLLGVPVTGAGSSSTTLSGMVGSGGGRLLGLFATNAGLWEFTPSTSAWAKKTDLFNSSTAPARTPLAYDGKDQLFMVLGSGNLLVLSLSTNAWTQVLAPPTAVMNTMTYPYYGPGPQTQMVVAGPRLFMINVSPYGGGATSNFDMLSYSLAASGDVDAGTWTATADATKGFGAGSCLVYPGTGDFVYATSGDATSSVQAYSISGDKWIPLPNVPVAVNAGSCMTYSAPTNSLVLMTGSTGDAPPVAGQVYAMPVSDAASWVRLPDAPGTTVTNSMIASPGGDIAADPKGGKFSLYVSPGSGGTELWRYIVDVQVPSDPALLEQRKASDDSILPPGAVLRVDQVKVQAVVSQPQGSDVKVQLEIVQGSSPFTGSGPAVTELGPLPSGSTVTLSKTGMALGVYKWRVRALNELGASSAWVNFTGASDAFVIASNSLPSVGSLAQSRPETGGALPVGSSSSGEAVLLEAVPSDPDGDMLHLELELRPVGTPFTGQPTHSRGMLTSGADESVEVSLAPGYYHWQARAGDEWGGTGAWTPFGGNAEGEADFQVQQGGSMNTGMTSPCSSTASAATASFLLIAAFGLVRVRR